MKKNKLKVSGKRLRAVLIPLLAILCTALICANFLCYKYEYNMNYTFGSGDIKITSSATGVSAEYYNKELSSDIAAMDEMRKFNERAAEESAVLLKNNGTLPLSENEKKINVFGWYFENAPYCAPASSSSSSRGEYVFPKSALESAGFELNESLLAEIRNGVPEYSAAPQVGRWNNDWAIPEYVPSEQTIKNAVEFSGVAIVWLTRAGTEGADVPQTMNDNAFYHNANTVKLSDEAKAAYGYDPSKHYMQLTVTEQKLLEKVTSAGFEKVIVIVNSDNPMELSFIRDNDKIDAALLVGGMGFYGFNALPKIMSGEVNPSGRLADTYIADFKADSVWVNHGDMTGEEYKRNGTFLSDEVNPQNNVYTNLTAQFIADNGLRANDENAKYVFQNYEEGIYSGYRYYETAFGNNEREYYKKVIYPFGYGLSYTEFRQRIVNYSVKGNNITVDVEVKNIGEYDGKETVQLYFTPPYGDKTTNTVKIEKSEVSLAGFAKTDILKAGETQTVKISVDKEQLTSFDDNVHGCYVLDDGDYMYTLRKNSHEAIYYEGDKQQFIYRNPSVIIYGEDNPRESEKFAHNPAGINYRAATTAFTETLKGISPSFKNMSRADFAGTFPQVADEIDKTASKELIEFFKTYDIANLNIPEDEKPQTGINSGLQLIDMRGKEYGDHSWEVWLNQWTVDEMIDITARNDMGVAGNTRLGLPASVNSDGTMGIKYKSIDFTVYGTILPLNCTACAFARTWNIDLFKRFGEICGEEALQYGMNGWYAPALNLHRSPLAGRYFDYFSEDPILCGEYGAAIATGAGSKGVVTYLKHFALNEGEYLRNYCSVWATEQVMRELYLKPFEIAIKKSTMQVKYYDGSEIKQFQTSAVHGIMSSFNRVGNTWSGGNAELLKTVLREEWGFCGIVISDNMRKEWTDMNLDIMLRGGGNVCLAGMRKEYSDSKSATFVKALREAVHGICFTVVNSNAMNGISPGSYISYGLAPWEKVLIAVDVIGFAFIALSCVFLVYRTLHEKRYPHLYDKNVII